MDAARRTLNQYLDLYQSMSPSQRGTLVAVLVMLVAAFGFLMFSDRTSSEAALSWGKVFTTDELSSAEQTLREADLNDFRRDGQRIMVPAKAVERYNAALLEGGSLPLHSMSELEKQLEKRSIFTSRDQLQAMKDVALEKELRRVIQALPDIEDASVKWARSETRGWTRNKTTVTATVNVRPRRGHELSPQLVASLRAAVANMVPDLKPADVVVFDQSASLAHTPDQEGDPLDSRFIKRVREFTRDYEQRITRALAYIPQVVVTVNVDLEDVKRSTERSTKLDPKETVALHLAEQSRSETFQEQAPRAEAGMNSNAPRSLDTGSGSEKARSVTETNSQAVNATSFSVSDKEFFAAMPRAVQVSVAIPEDYYRVVALKRGLSPGETEAEKEEFQNAIDEIREAEEEKVKAAAKRLIPSGSPDDAIHVSSIVQIEPDVPEPETPWTETAGSLIAQWGGAFGLALFALWALRTLSRSMPKLPEEEPGASPAAPDAGLPAPQEEHEHEKETTPPEPTPRDELQSMVRDNPEMTATVLSKWLQAAK